MLHTVAKLHYESDMSQVDIARQLGVSTATISRLLRQAREQGIVRIEVRPFEAPEALAERLAAALGLRRAAVVETPAAGLSAALAEPVGGLIRETKLASGGVLAIGWGRAVRAVVQTGLPEIAGVRVVPATGGMQQQAPHFQVNEFVRLAAQHLGGEPRFIHAPYLPSAESRDAFLADPTIRDNVALWERIDVAVVGVGMPHAPRTREETAATASERRLTGAAGDVIRHYFDAAGAILDWEGEGRMIAVSVEQLRRTPRVIGVATGEAKAAAIVGAARAGLIDALVTDGATAGVILDRLSRPG
ncbi:sugar-binding transcriptional regulator [Prosthecomicrobium pneumaticum]|uniref:DNA-binding transcriptional regulator LsrR (DeoR family) n=1 Tax=Prosthecomicrobium pneumaticum TaxID=81895 RepID=A0A7W9FJM4_9HYPH|nr:sugar-binding domain-containing protein [Prosthecomicrobium pneumaticum]MBB5751645.1 DNA-binding transcriptional regulator LsrR (DeoR family) [Prosthecomicrobium pneumaticum]